MSELSDRMLDVLASPNIVNMKSSKVSHGMDVIGLDMKLDVDGVAHSFTESRPQNSTDTTIAHLGRRAISDSVEPSTYTK